MQTVRIRVPGTTANMGPGYDCLGLALGIANVITVGRDNDAPEPERIAAGTAERFWAESGVAPFRFFWRADGDVPRSRGLGSSVTVRLGLLLALDALSGAGLGRDALFRLCAELEGHPDNAAPAAFGGFTVASGGRVARFEVDPALRFVLLVPDFEVSTPGARRLLPAVIPHGAAAATTANACRVVAAFASKDYGLLRGAFDDFLHQPYREPLVPFLSDAIRAGQSAGAFGGFLSGSGSTVCCVTAENPEGVAAAMLGACGRPGARAFAVAADPLGARTVEG